MVYQPLEILPSTDELPCSDETPVDNEEQNLLPNLLLLALAQLWSERMDWYFGVDMAVYHRTGPDVKIPIVPDAFLSIGVERRKDGKYRRSYATWEENGTVPVFVLEMVSHKYNDEYEDKMTRYARLGVLYYLVYNPEQWGRRGLLHEAFELYRLEQGQYQLQTGEPFWMPEIGIGIGRGRQIVGGIEQEALLWHDEQGQPYPLSEQLLADMRSQLSKEQQQVAIEKQRAESEKQRADKLADYLRSQGIDPDSIA
ncbi:MAG: Uma2 family endonuclease [Cyanobacteria bacterium J06606_4]